MAAERPLDLRPARPTVRRLPPLAVLLFVICILLVFNLSNWRFLNYLQTSKEQDLTRRLRSVAATIVQSLQNRGGLPETIQRISGLTQEEQSLQLYDFSDTTEFEDLAKRVQRLQQSSGLSEVVLFTPDGIVIYDSSYRTSPGDGYAFIIDAAYIQRAKDTGQALTPLYSPYNTGELYQRLYQQINNDAGRPIALLQASISADYVSELQTLRSRVFRLWFFSSLLLVIIGISLYRVFKYLVRLERSAMQSARIEAMGALAGGVAHELRNPLAIIRVLAEEVKSEQEPGSRSAQNASDIVAETKRLGEMVSHFLSLSRAPQKGEATSIADLREEIERVVQLVKKGAPATLRIGTELPMNAVRAKVDGQALRQVLLNLLLNAQEAIGEREGKIKVILSTRRDVAEVTIQDNGPGIPKRELARVFEPFYSTKRTGTGLGLAICRSIVENFGGEIRLSSRQNEGTQVVMELPLAPKHPGLQDPSM